MAICSLFIRRGGTIYFVAGDNQRYSSDLPQGGLEISGKLIFRTDDQKEAGKVEKLIISSLSVHVTILTQPSRMLAATTTEMKLNLPAVVTTTVPESKEFEKEIDVSDVELPMKKKTKLLKT